LNRLRKKVRQQALDGYLALVDTLAGSPAEQLTVLQTGIGHNPYTEPLYQHARRALATLGQPDAIPELRVQMWYGGRVANALSR
jgi:hypothetical protein